MIADGWRLAVGTLSAVPVRPPQRVGPGEARVAALLAPLAVVPAAAVVVGWLLLGDEVLGLPSLAVAVIAVGVIALGTRVMHWDGLSDVADGLTASYDRERSLEVMRSGTSGPAGVVATVLVALLQVTLVASLVGSVRGAVSVGVLLCLSRWAMLWCCMPAVPAARPGGLGATFVGSVPTWLAMLAWLVAAGLAWLAVGSWTGAAGVLAAVVAVGLLVARAVQRFGGVTGDVFGAAIELCFAALLLGG